MRVLSTDPARPSWLEQKGLREDLLCVECESSVSKWEDHVARVFRGSIPTTSRRDGNLIWVSGVDYAKFKLFQLSVLWRSGVSMLPFFGKVKIGPHAEILRKRLLANDPGQPHEYGCALYALTNKDGVDRGLITQPHRFRMDLLRGYHFAFGGLSWLYFVSAHPVPGPLASAFVQRSGTFALLPQDSPGPMYVERLAKKLNENRNA